MKKLKDEILARVSAKVDGNGIGITTWQCVETDSADKFMLSCFTELLLVHFSYFVDKTVIE